MKVIFVGKERTVKEIETVEAVAGEQAEVFTPADETVCFVMLSEDPFEYIICGSDEDGFKSLTDEQIERYLKGN